LAVCCVTFSDSAGIEHTVEVAAESLYEAALALVEFRKSGLVECTVGPATESRVLSYPAAPRQYSLTVGRFENWARFGICLGPKQKVHRDRIAALLGLESEGG
jgi:hypothetical protein